MKPVNVFSDPDLEENALARLAAESAKHVRHVKAPSLARWRVTLPRMGAGAAAEEITERFRL